MPDANSAPLSVPRRLSTTVGKIDPFIRSLPNKSLSSCATLPPPPRRDSQQFLYTTGVISDVKTQTPLTSICMAMHTMVSYIWSEELQRISDQLPSNLGRSSLVHDLHRALGLLDDENVRVVEPDLELGSRERLVRYHDTSYIDFLLDTPVSVEFDEELDAEKEKYGLLYDCPLFPDVGSYVSLVAAATSTACRQLLQGSMISISWDGGRHHGMRDRASGFCYVNDIVLGIMLLAKEGSPRPIDTPPTKPRRHKRPRIMYVDLDLHHGDGVAKAFHSPTHYLTDKERPPQVLTLSVHHSSPSFFPAPTPLTSSNTSSPFTLVIPLAAYPSTSTYHRIFVDCIEPVRKAFDPDYVVLQLGADGLPGDRVGQWGAWNADGVGGMQWCAEQVKSWGLPMCLLGGGGYNHPNTARAWAKVTAGLIGQTMADSIPHHEHFSEYGPSFLMDIDSSNAVDQNPDESLSKARESFEAIARRIETIIG